MSDLGINQGLPVDVTTEPIKVEQEDLPLLEEVKECAVELEYSRKELGRLFQILCNLRDRADSAERNLKFKREQLISKYGALDGRWAIDFETQTIVRVGDKAPNIV